MDEDVIVVDDFEPTQPSYDSSVNQNVGSSQANSSTRRAHHHNGSQNTQASSSSSLSSRLRARTVSNATSYAGMDSSGTTERATRSSTSKPKLQPKLKLKLSEKAAAQAPGMSFLGAYDRELDSDDEDLSFEEQFILRVPPGEDLEKLKKMVAAREITNDVWFKFKGVSRYQFIIIKLTYRDVSSQQTRDEGYFI